MAEEHGAGSTKLGHDMCITGGDAAEECPASSGGFLVVLGGDIVFDGEGDPVERPTNLTLGSLQVHLGCDRYGIWIELYD